MVADSIHGCIGKKMKKQLIYTFDDFVNLCKSSMEKIKTVRLDIPSIFQFERGVKARVQSKDTDNPPCLSNIVEIQVHKGSSSMFYKKSFDDDYQESSFLMPRAFLRIGKHKMFPDSTETRHGITPSEKEGILKILDHGFSSEKTQLWYDIDNNESVVDLCNSRESGEIEH